MIVLVPSAMFALLIQICNISGHISKLQGFIATQLLAIPEYWEHSRYMGSVSCVCLLRECIPTSYQHIGIPIFQPKWKPSCKPLNNHFVFYVVSHLCVFYGALFLQTWGFSKNHQDQGWMMLDRFKNPPSK